MSVSMTKSRKSRKGTSRTIVRKALKPTAESLIALQKQVTTLQRKVQPLSGNLMSYSYNTNVNPGNITGASTYSQLLTAPTAWTRIFGTDADDEQSHVFMQKSMKLRWSLVWNGEYAFVNYTIMLVSLTKVGATELFNPSTASLNTLVSGLHYISNPNIGTGGQVLLNKRYFRVHYYKNTYTLGSSGFPGEGKLVRFGTITYNKPIKYIGTSTDWRSAFNRSATANLFFLCFNNDNTADADISLGVNCLIQGTAV